LKQRVLQGAGWVTIGIVLSQLLRLASNLLLTRALAPEYFGAMAIVTVYLIGLNLFSDLGIGPNIIQSRRSRDPDFLNAAWTMQAMRGISLWLVCTATGWPVAQFYGEPQLTWLIPAAGFVSVINGFNSTSLFTQQRDMQIARLTLSELGSQFAALILMVGMATIWPSIWVLIAGSWFSALLKLWASHSWLPGIRHQLCWSQEIFRELAHFGKWIFLSTLLGFASNSSSSMILAKFVSMKDVGLFSIAATLAKAVEQAYQQIANRILFPLYNQLKSLPHNQLLHRVQQIRLVILCFFLPILWILIIWAQGITDILFDNRYQGIAWILRIYATGLIPTIISGLGPFYLANGDARMMSVMSGVRLVCFLVAMVIGWYWAGVFGLVTGMGCFTFGVYIADAIVQWKYRVWLPFIDFWAFISSAGVLGSVYIFWGFH
jgi:O-antigen/teichoic acid export membrane protein